MNYSPVATTKLNLHGQCYYLGGLEKVLANQWGRTTITK